MLVVFFFLSKVLFFVVTPSNICWFLIAGGLIAQRFSRWRRTGLKMATGGLVALLVLGFSPIGFRMMLVLENRFAPAETTFSARADAVGKIDGIILLGGFEDGRISRARGQMAVNESGERLLESIRLARRFGDVPLIFTGGAGGIVQRYVPAGETVRAYLEAVGIAGERISIESRSLNTWQNALYTRELLGPERAGGRFLLVTAAWHMPRSIGVFRKAGFDVVAWPADYRTAGPADGWRLFSFLWGGLERVDLATKEFIGLLVYRLTGRSSALWPKP